MRPSRHMATASSREVQHSSMLSAGARRPHRRRVRRVRARRDETVLHTVEAVGSATLAWSPDNDALSPHIHVAVRPPPRRASSRRWLSVRRGAPPRERNLAPASSSRRCAPPYERPRLLGQSPDRLVSLVLRLQVGGESRSGPGVSWAKRLLGHELIPPARADDALVIV